MNIIFQKTNAYWAKYSDFVVKMGRLEKIDIVDILICNLTEIKDFLWIVFTLIATIIAILTYRRARFTILQPLRTEVIQRQTDLLVQLLDFLEDDGIELYSKVDYLGIISCNVYFLIKHYGFILKDESLKDAVMNNTAGMLILKESGTLKSVELPQIFNSDSKSVSDNGKEDYELAKQGIVNLEMLYLTKQHMTCMEKMEYFIKNTFMPQEIQILLSKINDDITYNLKNPLKQELELFIKDLCMKHKGITEENSISVAHIAIYNYFQRKSKKSKAQIKEIRKITRQYLMIDKKWK